MAGEIKNVREITMAKVLITYRLRTWHSLCTAEAGCKYQCLHNAQHYGDTDLNRTFWLPGTKTNPWMLNITVWDGSQDQQRDGKTPKRRQNAALQH
jgi:hypothetical protein